MYVFIVVWSIWFVSEILLNKLLRAGKSVEQKYDKGYLLSFIGFGISLITGSA